MQQSNRDDYSGQELGERFALLSDQATEYALFLVGIDGTIKTWNANAERLFGYRAAEIVGKQYSQLFSSEDIQSQLPGNGLGVAFSDGKSTSDVSQRRKDGTLFPCRTTASAILDDNEEVHIYAVVVRDNTTSEKANSQAARASELIAYYEGSKSFFAMLAHELQSPLVPISTAIELLRRSEASPTAGPEIANLLQRQVDVLQGLVNDMLDISRITSARLRIFREPCDINKVIAFVCQASQANFSDRSQQLNLSLAPQPVYVSLDRKRIQQVMLNLLNNASKFTGAGGTIEVTVTTEGNQAVVRVSDNGIGLKQSMIPHIFDLLPRGDGESVNTRAGLGLGLAISRSIAELHDGSLTATSHGLKDRIEDSTSGSEFYLRLPLCAAPNTSALVVDDLLSSDSQCLERSSALVDGPVKVLIISDQNDFARPLQKLLELSGCEAEWVSTLEDTIGRGAAFSPQVVLLDMELQSTNPYAVAQQLDQANSFKHRTLISLTNGPPSESEIVRGLNSRFSSFLEKPVDFNRLKHLLNSAWHAMAASV